MKQNFLCLLMLVLALLPLPVMATDDYDDEETTGLFTVTVGEEEQSGSTIDALKGTVTIEINDEYNEDDPSVSYTFTGPDDDQPTDAEGLPDFSEGVGTYAITIEDAESSAIPNREFTETITINIFNFDVDVDSNNNGELEPGEDEPTDEVSPGKILRYNSGVTDDDAVQDFADGFDITVNGEDQAGAGKSAGFTSLQIKIEGPFDPEKAKLQPSYGSSDPASVGGTGEVSDGALRLWTKDGGVSRLSASIAADPAGDFVPEDSSGIKLEKFDVSSAGTISLNIEGVSPSDSAGDQEIEFSFVPGEADADAVLGSNTVKVTVLDLDLSMEELTPYDEKKFGGIIIASQNIQTDNDPNPSTTPNQVFKLDLTLQPQDFGQGTVEFSILQGATNLIIWEEEGRQNRLVLTDDAKTWTLGTDTIPESIYIEGLKGSSSAKDVKFDLSYTYNEDTEFHSPFDISIVDTDLRLPGLPNAIEYGFGGFIQLNTEVVMETKFLPNNLRKGTLQIDSNNSGKVTTGLSLPTNYDLENMPEDVFPATSTSVRAIQLSNILQDTLFLMQYDYGDLHIEDKLRLTVVDIDLDVDSNNNGAIEEENEQEENRENLATGPGKYLVANNGDFDADGVPDYADGIDVTIGGNAQAGSNKSRSFTPMKLRLLGPYPASAQVQFVYSGSDPAAITQVNGLASPAAGSLRLWKRQAFDNRKKASVTNNGDYIPPSTWLTLAQAGLDANGSNTYFIEGISAGLSGITAKVDVDGANGPLPYVFADMVNVSVMDVDLDVDSNNVNELERNLAEDVLEEKLLVISGNIIREPGKVFSINNGDKDNDGIPDYADGMNVLAGGNNQQGSNKSAGFTPIVVELKEPLNPNVTRIKFNYSDSDPAQLNTDGTLSNDRNLRLWTKNGPISRNKASVISNGHFVPANQSIVFSSLGTGRVITLYLEGIRPGFSVGDQLIEVAIDPDGSGLAEFTTLDRLSVTIIEVDLDTDSNNDELISDKDDFIEDMTGNITKPGRLVGVNNGDTDKDGIPDYADGFDLKLSGNLQSGAGVSQKFSELQLSIKRSIDLSKAKLKFTYPASNPASVSTSTFAPASGTLRIWKVDGNLSRKKASVQSGGDYVPAGVLLSPSDLGMTNGVSVPTKLYLEAVRKTDKVADQQIKVEVDPDGSGPMGFLCSDAIRATIVELDLAVDGNRDDVVDFNDPKDEKYLFWVNNDHDLRAANNEPGDVDYAEDDYLYNLKDADDDHIGNNGELGIGINHCLRDLEDFARLHIQKVNPVLLADDEIKFYLSFKNNTVGSPSINLFKAVDDTLDYLSDLATGDLQMRERKIISANSGEVWLESKYLNSTGIVPFIFEGKSQGKGDFTILAKKKNLTLCRKSISIELKDISTFYRHFKVTGVGSGIPAEATEIDPIKYTYAPKSNKFVMYIHGMGMEGDGLKKRWAETMFKRLWWQKYDGHVGLFNWPDYGFLNYNDSEFNSWYSAPALASVINRLNSGGHAGQVRLLAHSQGNIVAGEYFRRLAIRGSVHSYIATQAAISSQCYSNLTERYIDVLDTVNNYGHYPHGITSDPEYMKLNPTKTKIVNLFNDQDWALNKWEINNNSKPLAYTLKKYFFATRSVYPFYQYFTSTFPHVAYENLFMTEDQYEIFAYAAQSPSRALGAVSTPAEGRFSNTSLRDLMQYNQQHYSHSRQFRSNIIDERNYWASVITAFEIGNP